jgi:hypothetical protein
MQGPRHDISGGSTMFTWLKTVQGMFTVLATALAIVAT